jgi:hypothetical protein
MIVKTKLGDLPVRYGMNALSKFGDIVDKPMNEAFECLADLSALKVSEVLAFVYVGFFDGARFAKEECKVESLEQVGDMIDEDSELLTRMIKAYVDQSGDGEGEGDKKK